MPLSEGESGGKKTKTPIRLAECDEYVTQGDIYRNLKYYFRVQEQADRVEITELTFPFCLVLSQACDTYWMSEFIDNPDEKITKFMYSLLVVPIYTEESLKTGDYFNEVLSNKIVTGTKESAYNSDEKKVINKDFHYRYHSIEIEGYPKLMIDFKHYFTLSAYDLMDNKDKRIGKIQSQYSQKIVNKFAAFLSRVGIE